MTQTISAIIIAKNEESMIANCIETLRWCDEVIVINNDSNDDTVGIAHRLGTRVITLAGGFAEIRNEGFKRSKTDWVLYIDADERVTPALAEEIKTVIADTPHGAFKVNRTNVLYGKHLQHGGWQHDAVVRLFHRKALVNWAGDIHEHAEINGSVGELRQPLIHFTHRSIVSGLMKTIEWTPIEARLLAESNLPPVTFGTILRKGKMEFIRRIFLKQGWRDGMPGLVEALVQAINRMLVYMQVWELQQKPSLTEQYKHHEAAIGHLWKKAQ